MGRCSHPFHPGDHEYSYLILRATPHATPQQLIQRRRLNGSSIGGRLMLDPHRSWRWLASIREIGSTPAPLR